MRPARLKKTGSSGNYPKAVKQLVALFQVRYKMKPPFDIMQLVVLHQGKKDQYRYSVTSTDVEKLLFRSMYQVQVLNDKAMNILHDESMKEYNDAIAITRLQLVVLYQDVHFNDDTINWLVPAQTDIFITRGFHF
jgi:hypothetical protein